MKAISSFNHFNDFEMALKKYNQLKLKSMMGKDLPIKEQAFVMYYDNQVVKSTLDETIRLQFVILFNNLFE